MITGGNWSTDRIHLGQCISSLYPMAPAIRCAFLSSNSCTHLFCYCLHLLKLEHLHTPRVFPSLASFAARAWSFSATALALPLSGRIPQLTCLSQTLLEAHLQTMKRPSTTTRHCINGRGRRGTPGVQFIRCTVQQDRGSGAENTPSKREYTDTAPTMTCTHFPVALWHWNNVIPRSTSDVA